MEIDLTNYDHPTALAMSKKVIDQIPGQRSIIVDLDGPILQPSGLRFGLSVGCLPPRADEFLRSLTGDEMNTVLVYSSRPLWGTYAQFLNSPGGVIERIVKSLTVYPNQQDVRLQRQLEEVGITTANIFSPKGLEAVFFPLFKWIELVRIKLGRVISLPEDLHLNNTALVYIGDTRADQLIFQQLVRKARSVSPYRDVRDTFIQFHSACPGALF